MTRCRFPILRPCALAFALLALLAGSGCGQKGPLFLPQDKLDEIERKRDERQDDESVPAKTGRLQPAVAGRAVA